MILRLAIRGQYYKLWLKVFPDSDCRLTSDAEIVHNTIFKYTFVRIKAGNLSDLCTE